MNDEALIEAVASSWRDRNGGSPQTAPAWHDLDEEGRREAYERSLFHRRLEAAADPRGFNGTVHAVLARLKG